MFKRSLLVFTVLLIVALVAVGCKSSSQQAQTPAPQAAAGNTHYTGETETIDVILKFPEGWKETYAPAKSGGHQRGCPATQMQKILGVSFSSNDGCVIGKMDPNGLAAKSGLKVGDSIKNCNGGEVECPSTLDPLIWITQNNEAKLVVARPKNGNDSVDGAGSQPAKANVETK